MVKERMSLTTTSRLKVLRVYKQLVMTQTVQIPLILYKIKERASLKVIIRRFLSHLKKRKTWNSSGFTTSRKCPKNSLDPAWAC
jgi:hypothetical protein